MVLPTAARLHLSIRRSHWLARSALATRILLAAGFIPTGLVKALGQRFTTGTGETPVGAFFEALYQTGVYWQFLGWAQIVAGVLILVPRTAVLGAASFFAIILNIFVITISMDFAGTPVVTGLMLLATVALLLWDFHRWQRLCFNLPLWEPDPLPSLRWAVAERMLIALGALGGMTFFLGTRGLVSPQATALGLGIAALAAMAVGGLWITQDICRIRRTN